MKFVKTKETYEEYVANTYTRNEIALSHGKNATCYDFDGKEYIDLTSGVGVNVLGFSDDKWIDSITDQLKKLQHSSNIFYTTPCGEVAKEICKRSSMKKMFFSNSGAEANEGAIKTARKYSFDKYKSNRNKIVTLENSFHGRTIATLSATGQNVFHNYFFPFVDGFVFAKTNDIEDTIKKITDDVCAVMIEIVQGEGGVLPLNKEYVKAIADFCKENDVLLIVDEIQTGIGRTGTLFAYEQFLITPDIVTCAKGLGGGLPIGGILFGEKTKNTLGPGEHGSTFGGNPVICAGTLAILSRLDMDFLENVKRKGTYIKNNILKMPYVEAVDGMGLMLGIKLNEKINIKKVIESCGKSGLLLLSAKNKLRLLPPLTITDDEIEKALEILLITLKKF